MKKRNLIALLMAVCMMFSLLPVNAIAVGDEGTVPAEETLLSENGNDPAPAGSTNPAGDKDSIPDTGEKPIAAEEPVKDEESGKDEEPAKGEEPGKDGEPAEDEEGGETNVVPMRVVRPDTDKYLTYVFRVDGAEVSRQIVKKGDTLYQPNSPVKDGYKFTGWFVGASELAFGTVGEISESAQINVDAGFTEVLYVFFADTNGRIVHTKEGVKGDVIKTDDVTYGLENTTHAITGWYLEPSYQTPVDSVTLDKENITVYAKVEPGHWLHFDSDGGTYVAPQFYSADATTVKPNVEITKPGYTFSHWEYNGAQFNFGSPLTENITLKARWNAKADTQYTVIHWQEDADDDGYSYVENETLYGTTGAQTSARAKTYNGFTVRAITQETIKGNGATIVNIYYKRNVYEVKFYRRTSGFSGWSEMTNKTISAKYGANIRDQWPGGQWKVSPSGSVYQTNIDVMPLGGTSFYETSQYNGSAKYYLEDLNGNYVLDHTDTGASTTATISKEDRYNITGFTVNESKSGKDGERYNGASFYYDRNSYNVVYISGGKTVNTASYKYQQSIADAGNYKLTTPPVGMEKYIFAGWCADPFGLPEYVFDGKTMPAQNITVYAYWAAPTVYGFAHITMEGADGKELTVPYGGTIDESMLPNPQKPAGEGWTFAGWATKNGDTYTPFHFSSKIYENIELYPYYTNKSSYTVTYTDGKNTVTDMKRYASGAHADVQANSFAVPEGKVFLGWNTKADGTGTTYYPGSKIPVTDNLTLYAIWGEKLPTVSLTYNANGGKGGTHVENGYVNNGLVTLWDGSSFSLAGYTLVGWSTDPNAASAEYKTGSTARVDSTGDNILYAVWKANENTALYKVEFYCEQTNGAYTLAKTEPRTGTTDTTVSVTDTDKGYGVPAHVYDAANANNVESGTVKADGSLTLKLYFKRNTAGYTIHHYLKGTEVKVAPDQTGTMTIGDTLTASASTALGAEYTSAHVSSYSPSQSLEMKATGNVITVYYTVPLTITAENASRAYNAQPLTQPDFKVEGLVNGDQKKDITLSMTKESTITNVGSVLNVIDTTTVRFKGGELPGGYYELPTYQPGTLTITADETEVVVTITGNHNTLVYNGSEQSVTGFTTDVGEKTITVALKEGSKAEAKGTNADKYEMGLTKDNFTVTSQNYSNIKVVVVDGYLKIDPITEKVTVTVTEKSDTVTYNGQEHTVTGYKSISADNTLYDVEKNVAETSTEAWTAKGMYVGTYHVGIKAADFKNTSGNFTNVEFVIVDGTLKIDPVSDKVTVTITENADTVIYDTKEHSVTGYKSMTADNALYDVKKNVAETSTEAWTAKGTDVGEYPVGIKADDFENTSGNFTNVEFVIVDGALKIAPAESIVVKIAGNTKTVTYNGEEQSVEGYTVTSNPANADVTLVGKAVAAGTDAGTYPMGLTAADFTATSPNYETVVIKVTDGWLKIDPVSDKVTVTVTEKSGSVVYDGQEHSVTGYETMAADNALYNTADVAETPTEAWTAKGTNAGKYQVGIKSGDFKNTSVNFTNVAFVIADGELEITPVTDKVTVTVVEKSDNVTYDAAEHSITGYESMTADNALYDVTKNVAETKTAAWTAKGTEAGEYPVGIVSGDFKNTSKNFANVEFVIVDGALTITTDDTEVVVTVTGNTKTVVYDGTEHSVEGYTVDVNGLPITVTPKAGTEAKASGTNAGTYYMGLTADDFTAESNNYSNIRIVVTDGWLKIDPITDKVTVTITENAGTVEYDGKEHSVTGYASIVSDHALYDVANVAETPTDAWTAKGTDAGTYPVGIKSGDFRNTSGNFTNVEFVIVDGELVITRRGENPGSPVTLRADDNTVMFDGDYHGYVGHIATNLAEGHSVRSVKSDFTARNVGRYEDKIDLHDAIIVDADGKDVTRNYVLTYLPGTLEITPFEGEVVVTVTGNTALFRYDGKIHTVEGYTWEATVPFFTEDDIRFTGDATISEVRPGDYVMNLKDEEFSAANDNFTSVKFVVIDGSMRIYTVRYTVAWMFDTDQMLTGDSPNRYFTSMANYIDRSDISLVLHSGNVVADAGAQSQWDVFNNAMQPLYDDEEVDVLMIAAEKEAASGSLFLQQPVREDFKEEDLFENGKGFVRRFNIGEKSVILVGLGADAMTEEGYKWAREKFNSDKDASGILLVNNYLLEDMRKPDKIDERALDLEKNVVKACSNVRMVLSSSGGYSSHYEFYYGERKVIAINSDIEAAAKAGYFTQLTFNEDLNILSVTNLCPYTYDFVYNERQAYKERRRRRRRRRGCATSWRPKERRA